MKVFLNNLTNNLHFIFTTMAKSKKTNVESSTYHCTSLNRLTRGNSILPPHRTSDIVNIERPAHHIGRLLAAQQVDGVDGSVNNLFKGQYDESFGEVDPATQLKDPHLLQDALLRNGYKKAMSSRESE